MNCDGCLGYRSMARASDIYVIAFVANTWNIEGNACELSMLKFFNYLLFIEGDLDACRDYILYRVSPCFLYFAIAN